MRYRAIFISDTHLGSEYASTSRLLSFLEGNTADRLYLVGDIFDDHHDEKADWHCVRQIVHRILNGFPVVMYTPGNHDAWMDYYFGAYANHVYVQEKFLHRTYDGHNYLVTHGHRYDWVTSRHAWVAHLASALERVGRRVMLSLFGTTREVRAASAVNSLVNRFLMDRWFASEIAADCHECSAEAMICGHFHEAKMEPGYINCGDWVDSCTALVEHTDGRLEIVEWKS